MGKPNVNSRYYSGQGICLMGTRNATTGQPEGLTPIGNVPELSLAIEESTEEHKESWSGSRGTDVVLSTETSVSVSISFESLDPENLVLGLKGTSTEVSSGTITDEPATLYLEKWTYVKNLGISSVVVSDAAGATTYVDGTDYEVDLDGGGIRAITGGAISDAEDVLVDYDHATQYDIQALVTSAPERYFVFNGLNTRDSKAVRLTIPRLQTQPFTDLGKINDGIAAFSMSASALADNAITEVGKSKFFSEIILA